VLGLSVVQPLVAVGVLLLGLCVLAVKWAPFHHPVVLIGIPAALYLLLGAPNISTYRGVVQQSTVQFNLWNMLALLAGALVVAGGRRRVPRRTGGSAIGAPLFALALLPGIAGLALFSAKGGVAFLHPSSRVEAGGLALLLLETTTAALALYCYSVFSVRRAKAGDVIVILLLLGILADSGYRGWPIIGIGAAVFIPYYFGRLRLSPMRIFAIVGIIIVIVAGFDQIRRSTNPAELTTEQVAQQYGARRIPAGLRQVHFSLRESIALGQRLIEARNSGIRLPDSLLLADIETALPGKQTSGGEMIANLFGASGNAGLTPGAVGAAYMDLGYGCLVLFFALGAFAGWTWRRLESASYWGPVYFFTVVYILHFVNRGIPKLSYVIIPLMFLIVAKLSASETAKRRVTGLSLPSDSRFKRTAPPALRQSNQ
jgi:hypothetical protein